MLWQSFQFRYLSLIGESSGPRTFHFPVSQYCNKPFYTGNKSDPPKKWQKRQIFCDLPLCTVLINVHSKSLNIQVCAPEHPIHIQMTSSNLEPEMAIKSFFFSFFSHLCWFRCMISPSFCWKLHPWTRLNLLAKTTRVWTEMSGHLTGL